jgi:hypothetical protein
VSRHALTALAALLLTGPALAQPQPGLYVTSDRTNQVLLYDPTTGAPEGVFAQGGGLHSPGDLVYRPVPEPTALLALLALPVAAAARRPCRPT